MKLTISWRDFESRIKDYVSSGKELQEKFNRANSKEDLESFRNAVDSWSLEAMDYLKASISDDAIEFAHSFHAARHSDFKIQSKEPDVSMRIRSLQRTLALKIETLDFNVSIMSVLDVVVDPQFDPASRAEFNTGERISLVLSKLYDLRNNDHYPVKMILIGNGVPLKYSYEDRDIAVALEQRGFAELLGGKQIYARLTIEGRLFVEESRRVEKLDYEKINMDQLAVKLDEISGKLRDIGFGQEIIFDEIDSLKRHSKVLDKKSWGQLLIAKMAGLVSDKLIEKALASDIIKDLTGQFLRLD